MKPCSRCGVGERRQLRSGKVLNDCARCHAKWRRLYRLGIDENDFDKLAAAADGVCSICLRGSERSLAVDHDHETGEIRGLLCNDCNRAIGLLGDDPERIRSAAEYIEQPPARHLRLVHCSVT